MTDKERIEEARKKAIIKSDKFRASLLTKDLKLSDVEKYCLTEKIACDFSIVRQFALSNSKEQEEIEKLAEQVNTECQYSSMVKDENDSLRKEIEQLKTLTISDGEIVSKVLDGISSGVRPLIIKLDSEVSQDLIKEYKKELEQLQKDKEELVGFLRGCVETLNKIRPFAYRARYNHPQVNLEFIETYEMLEKSITTAEGILGRMK